MFSTMTMASSMTTPTAAARPPSVIRLKLMSKSFRKTMVTRMATGITSGGHQGGAPALQEADQHRHREREADQDALGHAGDGVAHQDRLVVERLELDVRRQRLADRARARALTASAICTALPSGCCITLTSTAGRAVGGDDVVERALARNHRGQVLHEHRRALDHVHDRVLDLLVRAHQAGDGGEVEVVVLLQHARGARCVLLLRSASTTLVRGRP